MRSTHTKLVAIIDDFLTSAVSADLDYHDRPMLQFVNSTLAYEIVAALPDARLGRSEYNHGPYRYIPWAEINTEHYRIHAAGALVEPEKDQSRS
jgi:hypothetical protein